MKSFTCSIFQSCVFSRLDLKGSTGKADAANTTLSAQPHRSLHSGTSQETESMLGHWVFLSYWKSRSLPRDVDNSIFVNSKQAWDRNKWEIFVSGISHVKLVFLLQTVNIATKLGQGNSPGISLRTDLWATGIPGPLVFHLICIHWSTRIPHNY